MKPEKGTEIINLTTYGGVGKSYATCHWIKKVFDDGHKPVIMGDQPENPQEVVDKYFELHKEKIYFTPFERVEGAYVFAKAKDTDRSVYWSEIKARVISEEEALKRIEKHNSPTSQRPVGQPPKSIIVSIYKDGGEMVDRFEYYPERWKNNA